MDDNYAMMKCHESCYDSGMKENLKRGQYLNNFFLFSYEVYILSLSNLSSTVLALSCPQGSKSRKTL